MKQIISSFLILLMTTQALAVSEVKTDKLYLKPRTQPTTGKKQGDVIYNSATSKLNVYSGSSWGEVGGGGGGIYSAGQNLISNNSWETDTTGWTASAGTYARTTTADHIVPPGVGAASWDPAASGNTLTGDDITITANDGLSLQNGVLSCAVKTAATDLKLQAFDGTNVLSPNATTDVVPSSSAGFVRYSVNFPFPSSGTVKPRFYSQSDSAIAYIDDCYFGKAEGFNLSQVSQAEMYGYLKYAGTANCQPTTGNTAGALTEFAANNNCPTPSVAGNASAPATKVPRIKFATLPPGEYFVTITGVFALETTGVTANGLYRISDGTTQAAATFIDIVSTSPVSTRPGQLSGRFVYTTAQTNIEFRPVALSSSDTNDPSIFANIAGVRDLEFTVYRFPTSSQTAYTADQSGWNISLYGTGSWDLGTSNQANATVALSTGTFTVNTGSDSAQLTCSGGNAPTSTVCGTGNEQIGIYVTIPKAGMYEHCFSGSHSISDTGSGTNASVTTSYAIGTTSGPTSDTLVTPLENYVTSRLITNSAGGGEVISVQHPVSFCRQLYETSSGLKTYKMFYSQTANGTIASNLFTNWNWSIKPITANTPAPLLVNSVVTNNSGVYRTIAARLNCDSSSSITSQSGTTSDGVASIGNISSAVCTVTLATGTFSATPYCSFDFSTSSTANTTIRVSANSATSVSIEAHVGSTGADATTFDGDLFCYGPK